MYRNGSRWRRSRAGADVNYRGRAVGGWSRSPHSKGALASARLGEPYQTEEELHNLLLQPLPFLRSSRNPYIPNVQSVVLHSHGSIKVTPTHDATFMNAGFLHANDPFDPLGSFGSARADGDAALAALYDHYMVTKAELKVTFYNYYKDVSAAEAEHHDQNMIGLISIHDSATADTLQDSWLEIVNGTWAETLTGRNLSATFNTSYKKLPAPTWDDAFLVAPVARTLDNDATARPGVATIAKTLTMSRYPIDVLGLGDPYAAGTTMSRYKGASGVTPTNKLFFIIGLANRQAFNTTGTSNPVRIEIELLQHCTYWQPTTRTVLQTE